MKKHNSYQDKPLRHFEQKVNHLQSFIGLPMWNGRNPTLSEMREYDRRLLEIQALGFENKKKGLISRLSTCLKNRFATIFNVMTHARQKTKHIEQEIKQGVKSKNEYCC